MVQVVRHFFQYSETFINPETGEFYEEGDILKNHKLANTLRVIADEGADAIYGNGTLGEKLVEEIRKEGGIITLEDLQTFQPKWGIPTASKILNDTLYTLSLPATGDIINFIINVLNGYKAEEHTYEYHKQDKLIYHRLMEAFKFAFAKRTRLGDEMSEEVVRTLAELRSVEHADFVRGLIRDDVTFNDFGHYGANASVQLDYGTGHISILAPNGDAVAFTSTINSV
jgi:gamma-glutamyltranspeptidase / glutathione hydrolase / leukotriene-C4 hydrolase